MWAVSKLGNFLEELDGQAEGKEDEPIEQTKEHTPSDSSSLSSTGGSVGSALVGRGLGFLSSARAAAGSAAAVAAKAAETDWAKGAVGNLGSLLGNDDDAHEDAEREEGRSQATQQSLVQVTFTASGSLGIEFEELQSPYIVQQIHEGGLAFDSGLQPGDRLIRVGDEEVNQLDWDSLVPLLQSRPSTLSFQRAHREPSCKSMDTLPQDADTKAEIFDIDENPHSGDMECQPLEQSSNQLDVTKHSVSNDMVDAKKQQLNSENVQRSPTKQDAELDLQELHGGFESNDIAQTHEHLEESTSLRKRMEELQLQLQAAERSVVAQTAESSKSEQCLEAERKLTISLRQQCEQAEAEQNSLLQQMEQLKAKLASSFEMKQTLEDARNTAAVVERSLAEERQMNATLNKRCEEYGTQQGLLQQQLEELKAKLYTAEKSASEKTKDSTEIETCLEGERSRSASLRERCEKSELDLASLREELEESKRCLDIAEHSVTAKSEETIQISQKLETEINVSAMLRQRCEECAAQRDLIQGKLDDLKAQSSIAEGMSGNVVETIDDMRSCTQVSERESSLEAERDTLSQQVEILKSHLEAKERSTISRIAEAVQAAESETVDRVASEVSKTRMEVATEVAAKHEEEFKRLLAEHEQSLLDERGQFASREEKLCKRIQELENEAKDRQCVSEVGLSAGEREEFEDRILKLQQQLVEAERVAPALQEETQHRQELDQQLLATAQQIQRLQERIFEVEQESAQKDQRFDELMSRATTQEEAHLQEKALAEKDLREARDKLTEASKKIDELEQSLSVAKRKARDQMAQEKEAVLEEAQRDMQEEFDKMMKGKDKEIRRLQNEVGSLDNTMHTQNDEMDRLRKECSALQMELEQMKKSSQGNLCDYQKDVAALTLEHEEKIKELEEKRQAEERQKNELVVNIKNLEERARTEVAQLEAQKSQFEQRQTTLQQQLTASQQQCADLSLSLGQASQLPQQMDSIGKKTETDEAKLATEAELRSALERLHSAEDKLLDSQANRDAFAKETDMFRAELKVARDEIRYLEEQLSKSKELTRDLQAQHTQKAKSESPAQQIVIEQMQKDFEDRMERFRDEVKYLRQKCDEKEKRCEHLLAEKSSLSMELRTSRTSITPELSSRDLEAGAEKSIDEKGKASRSLIRSLPLGSPAWLVTIDEPLRIIVKQLAIYPPARILFFAYILLFHVWVLFMMQMSILKPEEQVAMPVEALPAADEPPASDEA